MQRTIQQFNITYEMERKSVKNINLRIRADGSIYVSANRLVPTETVDAFVASKVAWIWRAQARIEAKPSRKQYFEAHEIRDVVVELCKKVYPYFEKQGVAFPQIRFRKMVSQWGNCRAKQGILTFNTALMYAPMACIEYVVLHEFTHFLQQNHSRAFYDELAKVCPAWKTLRKQLKEISLR